MHDRVFLPCVLSEVCKNRPDISAIQQHREIINGSGDAIIQIDARDLLKHFAQKRIGFRKLARGNVAGEFFAALSIEIATRGKQAVGNGLTYM